MTKYNLIRQSEKRFVSGLTTSVWSENKIIETFDSYTEAVLCKLETENLVPNVKLTIEVKGE